MKNSNKIERLEIYKRPKIIHYYDVFSEDECKKIIKLVEKQGLEESQVVDSISGKLKNTDYRTSTQWYDGSNDCSFVLSRLCEISKHDIDNFEALQVLKYQEGQEYKNHCDFFNHKKLYHTDNDRIATFLIYLNQDFVGGETNFPKIAVKTKAYTGSVVYFEYSYSPTINRQTLHAGMPVTDGVKYIAVTWVREKGYFADPNDSIEEIAGKSDQSSVEDKPISEEEKREHIRRINQKLKEEFHRSMNTLNG